ncbi:MAG TPA: metalloregulator ArsR/SmtB family transcription factor [bacterium]|nr:metalloregulator ArsR/SmtB family transcription factor [bacterium]
MKLPAPQIEKSAGCIKAMAHPLRLSILALLQEGEKNVQDLTQALGAGQSNVSQHLAQMRARGLVTARREGNMVYYAVGHPKIARLMALMREVFCGE